MVKSLLEVVALPREEEEEDFLYTVKVISSEKSVVLPLESTASTVNETQSVVSGLEGEAVTSKELTSPLLDEPQPPPMS